MYKIIPTILMAFTLVACGGDGDSNALSCDKPINSFWTGINVALNLDLSDFEINQSDTVVLTFPTGEECTGIGKIEGDECSGTLIVSSGQYTGGGSGDPGCADLIGTDRYTIEGSEMTVCDSDDESACNFYE